MMNDNKGQLKLCNVIFPIWLLWLFPPVALVVLPANFVIDLLVVVLTLKATKVAEVKPVAKGVIWKVWGFGFLSDFIGTVPMFSGNFIEFTNNEGMRHWWYENITSAVNYNPFEGIWGFLWVTACVIISGICIYLFDSKIALKNSGLEDSVRKKLALSLAIFTAPYLFYLPTAWFY